MAAGSGRSITFAILNRSTRQQTTSKSRQPFVLTEFMSQTSTTRNVAIKSGLPREAVRSEGVCGRGGCASPSAPTPASIASAYSPLAPVCAPTSCPVSSDQSACSGTWPAGPARNEKCHTHDPPIFPPKTIPGEPYSYPENVETITRPVPEL